MIESSAVEDTLVAAETVRRARDLAITIAIALCAVPILYVINLVLMRGDGAVLITGYTLEITITFLVSLLLMGRLITNAVRLNRLLKDPRFLCEAKPMGSAHLFLFRRVLGLE